jgi:hypothetical protein
MSVQKFAIAVALVTGAFIFAAPADAKIDCRHHARDCHVVHHSLHVTHHAVRERDWYLHRPSTPRERAQTRALNHQELAAVTAPVAPMAPAYGGRNYERELREYRQAQRRYEYDMRRYQAGPREMRDRRDMRDPRYQGGRNYPAAMRHRPVWPEDLDNDPCAPTGGMADPSIAAPVNLDSAATGLTQFNARASGERRNCRPRR